MTNKILVTGKTSNTHLIEFLNKFNLEIKDIIISNDDMYEAAELYKPWLIISINKSIDKDKIKALCIEIPSEANMYEDMKKFSIMGSLIYDYYANWISKKLLFKTEEKMIEFIKNLNTMKVVNIDVDGQWKNVLSCISNKKNYRIQFDYHNYCYVECNEKDAEKHTLKGKPCKKFHYNKRSDLPYDTNKIYEDDIRADYRFIIDYFDYFECVKLEELNILTYDIETNKSVDVVNTPGEIISIVYLLNDKYEFLIIDNKQNNYQCFEGKKDVKIFEKEKDMIAYFMEKFAEANIVSGFNIAGFDTIYLLNRAKKLGLDSNKFSPIRRVKNNVIEEKDRMDAKNINIYGLTVIDSMNYSKNKYFVFSLNKPERYNLDYLGKFLNLGEKLPDKRGPYTLFIEEPLKLYLYNIQDVKLCRDIENYIKMYDYLLSFKGLMSTFNLSWSLYNSKVVDFFILCNYSKKYVFPGKKDNPKEELPGAFVKIPISGIYDNVCIGDFSSLYPNCIRNFNISFETISSDKNEFKNCIEIYDEIDKEKYYIDRSKRGFLAEVVDKIMFMKIDLGKKVKDPNEKDALIRYNAIKSVINSIYGVFAYRYFRCYDIRIARCITAVGRDLITHGMSFVDSKKEYKVIAGDTDSMFISNKKKIINEEAIKDFIILIEEVNKEISKYMKDKYNLDNKYIEMECETVFYRMLQSQAKKCYYGNGYFIKGKMNKELKIYSRGTSLVKKDTPFAMRKPLNQLLTSIIMRNSDLDIKNAIKEVKNYIKNLSYNQLLISKQLNREFDSYKQKPQHIKAAEWSNTHLGTNFNRANYKMGMLYVKSTKYPNQEVITLEEEMDMPKDFIVNYAKYFDLFVQSKLCLFSDDFKKFFNNNHSLMEFAK